MPTGDSPLSINGVAASAKVSKDDVAAALIEAGYPAAVAMEATGHNHTHITDVSHHPDALAASKTHSPSPAKVVWAFMSPEAIVEACRRRQFTPVMLYEHLISLIQTGTPSEKRWATERFCKSLKEIAAFQIHLQEVSETRRTSNTGDTVTEQSVTLRRVIAAGMEQLRHGVDHLNPDLVSVHPPSSGGPSNPAPTLPPVGDASPDPAQA